MNLICLKWFYFVKSALEKRNELALRGGAHKRVDTKVSTLL